MADIKSAEERSRNMAAIKSKDTAPEVYLRKLLFAEGFRYRKNRKVLNCRPDLWMKKYNTAVFVNGCFWHRHPGCKYSYTPKSRTDFWEMKFKANITRDQKIYRELKDNKIRILIVWECTIKQMKKSSEHESDILNVIMEFLKGGKIFLEI